MDIDAITLLRCQIMDASQWTAYFNQVTEATPSDDGQTGHLVCSIYNGEEFLFSVALVRNGAKENFVIGATDGVIRKQDVERLIDELPKIKGNKKAMDKDEYVFFAKTVEEAEYRFWERIEQLIDITIDNDMVATVTASELLKPKAHYQSIRSEKIKTSVRTNERFSKIAESLFQWNKDTREGKHVSEKVIQNWMTETKQTDIAYIEKYRPLLIVLCNEFKKQKNWREIQWLSEQTLSLFKPDELLALLVPKRAEKKKKKVAYKSSPKKAYEELSLF